MTRILVLGGGPAGYVAAGRAAQLGAEVTLVEAREIGGTCLNRGCVPTKAMVAGADFFSVISKAYHVAASPSSSRMQWRKSTRWRSSRWRG